MDSNETATSAPKTPGFWAKAVLLFIVIAPLAALVYIVYDLWNTSVDAVDLSLLLGLYALTTLGIGIGFHRMLTHKGFDAPAPVRFVLLALGSMAVEGPAIEWSATHLKHHAKSDKEGDPHSPLEGFWHAHFGWLFRTPQIIEDLYGRQFKDDKVARFIDRTFFFWVFLGLAIPFGVGFWANGWIGAFTGIVWGGFVRVGVVHHVTWSVNSICHTFGRQPFDTPDRSKNEWIVGLLAFGEGWHNNHHAFPRSAVHGLRWYQFDLSAYLIWIMARLRLVRNVWVVPRERMRASLRSYRRQINDAVEKVQPASKSAKT
jgi:stearoyl-CoA desaturase (Delta-9 desaturase)